MDAELRLSAPVSPHVKMKHMASTQLSLYDTKPLGSQNFETKLTTGCPLERDPPFLGHTQTKKYHFCLANAEFMLNEVNNEHLPEILRERRRFYREIDREQDFWIVPNPAFLDAMPEVAKKVRQPCVAVVTTDKVWNDFIKLRMDRVYKGCVEGSAEECLASSSLIAKDAFAAPDPKTWTAPYSKYAAGWWEAFYFGNEKK